MLTTYPAERYPPLATVFMLALLALIASVIVGVMRHWRWLFWLLLIAFGFAVLQVTATILELTGILPNPVPVWYSLSRMGAALVQVEIAVWMVQIYRQYGVWAMGKKRPAMCDDRTRFPNAFQYRKQPPLTPFIRG